MPEDRTYFLLAFLSLALFIFIVSTVLLYFDHSFITLKKHTHPNSFLYRHEKGLSLDILSLYALVIYIFWPLRHTKLSVCINSLSIISGLITQINTSVSISYFYKFLPLLSASKSLTKRRLCGFLKYLTTLGDTFRILLSAWGPFQGLSRAQEQICFKMCLKERPHVLEISSIELHAHMNVDLK